MATLKEDIAKMIHDLPDDSSLEDIQYHLYVLEKIRHGQEAIQNGNGVSHEDIHLLAVVHGKQLLRGSEI